MARHNTRSFISISYTCEDANVSQVPHSAAPPTGLPLRCQCFCSPLEAAGRGRDHKSKHTSSHLEVSLLYARSV